MSALTEATLGRDISELLRTHQHLPLIEPSVLEGIIRQQLEAVLAGPLSDLFRAQQVEMIEQMRTEIVEALGEAPSGYGATMKIDSKDADSDDLTETITTPLVVRINSGKTTPVDTQHMSGTLKGRNPPPPIGGSSSGNAISPTFENTAQANTVKSALAPPSELNSHSWTSHIRAGYRKPTAEKRHLSKTQSALSARDGSQIQSVPDITMTPGAALKVAVSDPFPNLKGGMQDALSGDSPPNQPHVPHHPHAVEDVAAGSAGGTTAEVSGDCQEAYVQQEPLQLSLAERLKENGYLTYFDICIGFFVVLNCVVVGAQTDYLAQAEVGVVNFPGVYHQFSRIFTTLFTFEIIFRIYLLQCEFFREEDYFWSHALGARSSSSNGIGRKMEWWNIFDLLVVSLQIVEEVLYLLRADSRERRLNFTFLRILRFFSIVQIVRSVWVLRWINELRALVMSIRNSVSCLAWTMLILTLMIYITSIWMLQLVRYTRFDHNLDEKGIKALEDYYGSITSTALTLFAAITGGIDWKDAVFPLRDQVPALAPTFMVYIVFALFLMMNVVNGVFVEIGLRSAKEDTDNFMLNNVRELFEDDAGGDGISRDDFMNQLGRPQFQAYFKAIDVDPSEAFGVFSLLDLNESGAIDAEEFLNGCLRLRGPAKALDLALLFHEVRIVTKHFQDHVRHIEHHLKPILAHLGEDFEPLALTLKDQQIGSVNEMVGLVDNSRTEDSEAASSRKAAKISVRTRARGSDRSASVSLEGVETPEGLGPSEEEARESQPLRGS